METGMPTHFLSGETILEAVRAANAQHSSRRLGVAYWGGKAAERLGLAHDLAQTRIVCDLWSDGCDPDTIADLLKRGATVRTVEAFHAKTYLYPDRVVIGSANASRSGLGDTDEPPRRMETAVLCDDGDVLRKAEAWFESAWKKGVPVDSVTLEVARPALEAIRAARRPTLLQVLACEPSLFAKLDLWLVLRTESDVSDEADLTWDTVKEEYGADDMQAYGEEYPFYEVEPQEVAECPAGRVFLDFERPRKKRAAEYQGIWKVRADGLRPVSGTTRSLVLLDRLPSLCGCRISKWEMSILGQNLSELSDKDRFIDDKKIRHAIENAWHEISTGKFLRE